MTTDPALRPTPALRVALPADMPATDALVRASTRAILPAFGASTPPPGLRELSLLATPPGYPLYLRFGSGRRTAVRSRSRTGPSSTASR